MMNHEYSKRSQKFLHRFCCLKRGKFCRKRQASGTVVRYVKTHQGGRMQYSKVWESLSVQTKRVTYRLNSWKNISFLLFFSVPRCKNRQNENFCHCQNGSASSGTVQHRNIYLFIHYFRPAQQIAWFVATFCNYFQEKNLPQSYSK